MIGKKGVVGKAVGLAVLALAGGTAEAAILSPGVYLLTQDIGYSTADSLWEGSTFASLDDYAGGTGVRAHYLTGNTIVRRGFDYGLMGEVNLSYQWDTLNAGQYPFSAGAVRGGAQFVRLGVYKSLTSVSPKSETSFWPSSPIGDLEVFTGGYIPLRKEDKYDFFTSYEGSFKLDFGLHYTYYGSLVNPEAIAGGMYRSGFSSQGFANVGFNFHWDSCPIEWFRYSTLKPYAQYLHTFGGYQSSVAADFLSDYTTLGYAPIRKLDVELLGLGVEFMHPFSYVFFAAVRYSRAVYARNTVQYNEFGLTLNYLF